MARPEVDSAARKKQRSEHYARTDEAFYAQVRAENGGELPPDLVGPDGKPRKLTQGPEDSHYRLMWQECAAGKKVDGAAKTAGGACQGCPGQGSSSDPGDTEQLSYCRGFQVIDPDSGAPVVGADYVILVEGGSRVCGKTDSEGRTAVVNTDESVEVTAEIWAVEGYEEGPEGEPEISC